jgi:hypothetical protein
MDRTVSAAAPASATNDKPPIIIPQNDSGRDAAALIQQQGDHPQGSYALLAFADDPPVLPLHVTPIRIQSNLNCFPIEVDILKLLLTNKISSAILPVGCRQ